MSEEHRLGTLQVGVAREIADLVGFGAGVQHVLQRHRLAGDRGQLTLAPQTKIGGDLIVAAPCGVQLGASGSGELGDPTFDRRVQVLVRVEEREGVVG